MFEKMGTHYERMKEEVGLKDAFEKSDDEEEQTEAIFKKLRPHSKYKFSDVLQMQEKMNPRQINKAIGPMGVVVRDQQLALPRSLAEIKPVDPIITDLIKGGQQRKKRPDKHRFASKPTNPRTLHNQMMLEEYAAPPKTGYPNKYIASTTTQSGFPQQIPDQF